VSAVRDDQGISYSTVRRMIRSQRTAFSYQRGSNRGLSWVHTRSVGKIHGGGQEACQATMSDGDHTILAVSVWRS